MNWVGGARKRIKQNYDQKKQSEFFKKKRLEAALGYETMETSCKTSASSDLITFNFLRIKAMKKTQAPKPTKILKQDLEGLAKMKTRHINIPETPIDCKTSASFISKCATTDDRKIKKYSDLASRDSSTSFKVPKAVPSLKKDISLDDPDSFMKNSFHFNNVSTDIDPKREKQVKHSSKENSVAALVGKHLIERFCNGSDIEDKFKLSNSSANQKKPPYYKDAVFNFKPQLVRTEKFTENFSLEYDTDRKLTNRDREALRSMNTKDNFMNYSSVQLFNEKPFINSADFIHSPVDSISSSSSNSPACIYQQSHIFEDLTINQSETGLNIIKNINTHKSIVKAKKINKYGDSRGQKRKHSFTFDADSEIYHGPSNSSHVPNKKHIYEYDTDEELNDYSAFQEQMTRKKKEKFYSKQLHEIEMDTLEYDTQSYPFTESGCVKNLKFKDLSINEKETYQAEMFDNIPFQNKAKKSDPFIVSTFQERSYDYDSITMEPFDSKDKQFRINKAREYVENNYSHLARDNAKENARRNISEALNKEIKTVEEQKICTLSNGSINSAFIEGGYYDEACNKLNGTIEAGSELFNSNKEVRNGFDREINYNPSNIWNNKMLDGSKNRSRDYKVLAGHLDDSYYDKLNQIKYTNSDNSQHGCNKITTESSVNETKETINKAEKLKVDCLKPADDFQFQNSTISEYPEEISRNESHTAFGLSNKHFLSSKTKNRRMLKKSKLEIGGSTLCPNEDLLPSNIEVNRNYFVKDRESELIINSNTVVEDPLLSNQVEPSALEEENRRFYFENKDKIHEYTSESEPTSQGTLENNANSYNDNQNTTNEEITYKLTSLAYNLRRDNPNFLYRDIGFTKYDQNSAETEDSGAKNTVDTSKTGHYEYCSEKDIRKHLVDLEISERLKYGTINPVCPKIVQNPNSPLKKSSSLGLQSIASQISSEEKKMQNKANETKSMDPYQRETPIVIKSPKIRSPSDSSLLKQSSNNEIMILQETPENKIRLNELHQNYISENLYSESPQENITLTKNMVEFKQDISSNAKSLAFCNELIKPTDENTTENIHESENGKSNYVNNSLKSDFNNIQGKRVIEEHEAYNAKPFGYQANNDNGDFINFDSQFHLKDAMPSYSKSGDEISDVKMSSTEKQVVTFNKEAQSSKLNSQTLDIDLRNKNTLEHIPINMESFENREQNCDHGLKDRNLKKGEDSMKTVTIDTEFHLNDEIPSCVKYEGGISQIKLSSIEKQSVSSNKQAQILKMVSETFGNDFQNENTPDHMPINIKSFRNQENINNEGLNDGNLKKGEGNIKTDDCIIYNEVDNDSRNTNTLEDVPNTTKIQENNYLKRIKKNENSVKTDYYTTDNEMSNDSRNENTVEDVPTVKAFEIQKDNHQRLMDRNLRNSKDNIRNDKLRNPDEEEKGCSEYKTESKLINQSLKTDMSKEVTLNSIKDHGIFGLQSFQVLKQKESFIANIPESMAINSLQKVSVNNDIKDLVKSDANTLQTTINSNNDRSHPKINNEVAKIFLETTVNSQKAILAKDPPKMLSSLVNEKSNGKCLNGEISSDKTHEFQLPSSQNSINDVINVLYQGVETHTSIEQKDFSCQVCICNCKSAE